MTVLRVLIKLLALPAAYLLWSMSKTVLPAAGDLQNAALAIGAALALWLVSNERERSRLRGLIRLLAAMTLVAAMAFAVWPFIRLGFSVWAQTPVATVEPPIWAWLTEIDYAVRSYANTIAYYWTWALCNGAVALVPLALLTLAARPLIIRPFKDLIGLRRTTQDGPWRGGWMEPPRRRQLAGHATGVPLGLYGGSLLRYQANPQRGWLAGHHMVIAGTRAGKGVACVLPAIIDHDGPVVVIDIKGENFAVCRRHRASLGRRQIVLNPFGLVDGRTACLEPLRYVRSTAMLRDIAAISQGLIKPEGSKETTWISNGARELLEAACELVLTVADPDDRTLLKVADLLLAPNRLATFEAWTQSPDLCSGRVARAGATILQMGDRQRGAVLDCLAENLSWLKYDEVRAMLSGADFDLDELLDGGVDLYLVIPQDMTDRLSNFARLFMTLALGVLTRQDGRRTAKQIIMPVFDEFTRLGRMEKVLEIATIAAGAGVEAVFVVQDRGSLDAVYGADGAGTLLGSCATTRIFGLGRADERTAHWAESLMPATTVLKEGRRTNNDGVDRNENKDRLMDAAGIAEMPADEMLCLIRSNKPLKIKQILSYKHRQYRAKLDPNPVVRA